MRVWRSPILISALIVLAAGLLEAPAARGAKPLVFAVVPKGINDPFFDEVKRGCEDEAAKLGIQCDYTGPAEPRSVAQIQILEGLIRRRVDGVAISPVDGRAIVPTIKKAAMGTPIPVVTFDSDAAPGSNRLAFIGTNNYTGGVILGKAFVKAVPGGGTYAIITGGLNAVNLIDRMRGVRDGIKEAYEAQTFVTHKFTEVSGSPMSCNDDPSRAVQLIEQSFRVHPDLSGIITVGGWPLLAPDALRQALNAKKAAMMANKFTMVAFDTLKPELELVKDGYVSTLVGQRPYQMGVDSMDALYNYVTKKVKPKDPTDTGLDVVTKANVEEFLKKAK